MRAIRVIAATIVARGVVFGPRSPVVLGAGLLLALAWPTAVIAEKGRSPEATVRAKFESVNRHDLDAIVASYAQDAVLIAPDMCAPRRGRSEVKRTYTSIFSSFPHIQAELLEVIAQGEHVAARVMLRSNDANMSFELPIANFFTVQDGLIVRDEGLFDLHGRPCTP